MIPLAPIYLIGIAAAGIPLVLHLIYRRRAQKVLFSTIRFLKLSNERTAHRRRIQNLLLLLLRMVLFILFALALSQFIITMTEGSGPSRPPAAVIIVMDNSYSMAATHEGKTRYLLAKGAAVEILEDLLPGDEAAVLFTCAFEPPPKKLARPQGKKGAKSKQKPGRYEPGTFTFDTQGIYNVISRSRCSARRGNVMHEIKKAQKLLLKRKRELREIYVLTDMQKLAWETGPQWDEEPETAFERERKGRIPVFVFDAGKPVTRNLVVREIRVSAQALVRDSPITIDADIYNPMDTPVNKVIVSLFVSGVEKEKRQLGVGADAVGTVAFRYEPAESGVQCIQVRLHDKKDALAVDNMRSLKLEVKERIRVLIVQDAGSAVEVLDQSYFLERALDPSIALSGPSASRMRPDRLLAKDLTRARLDDYEVVFVLGIKSMPDAAAASLKEFVKDGGGLIFFAGDNMDVKEYARLFATGTDPLLPVSLRPIETTTPDRRRFKQVTSVDESHFVFAPFRGLNLLRAVRVYKSATIDLNASTPMKSLADLEDGQPLLLEHSSGRGKVVFITVSADGTWSNLPVTDVFLPMVHQLVYHLCGSFEETDSVAVGVEYHFPKDLTPAEITVRRPNGVQETLEPGEVKYADTFEPGPYTYVARGAVARRGAFVVNPDTTESDLKRLSKEDLTKHLAPSTVRFWSDADEMRRVVAPLRTGVPLRHWFILITIILVVFETVISNWITPKSQARKQPTLITAEEGAST